MPTEHLSERRRRFPVPRSLLGRMLLLTLLAVLFAQALSSVIWVSQLRATQLEGLVTSARSLAHSMTASVSYFRSLPVAYRPLVLDQLRWNPLDIPAEPTDFIDGLGFAGKFIAEA